MGRRVNTARIKAAHRPTTRAAERRREAVALALPSVIPVLLFSVAPLFVGIVLAFTDARLVRRPDYNFVGLDHFADLLSNDMFWGSFKIGMIWALSVTVLQMLLGMILALLLNSNLRFRGLTRVLALIPWAMPPVVVAIMWRMLYSPNAGPINAVLDAVGLPGDINWLGSFDIAFPAVIVVGVWVGMPQTTVTLLAGLQQISPETLEAAQIDGAGAFAKFRYVTLPAITPIVAAIGSLNFIWNFNSFSLVYVLTEGGPGGRTMLPMLFTYIEAFKNRNIGYAAAMGLVLVIIVVALLAIYLKLQMRADEDVKR